MEPVSSRAVIVKGLLRAVAWLGLALGAAAGAGEITFNKNFEGGALGKIESVGATEFRCHVEGQSDERGRNRQGKGQKGRLPESDFSHKGAKETKPERRNP